MSSRDESPAKVWIFLDESVNAAELNLVMVAAAVFASRNKGERQIARLFDELSPQADLWQSGSKHQRFVTKGFHFTTDCEEVRDRMLRLMEGLNFRGHVAFCELRPGVATDDLVGVAYIELIRPLLLRYRASEINLIFEQKSELDRVFGTLVRYVQQNVETEAAAEIDVKAHVGSKADPLLAVADYLMGVVAAANGRHAADFQRNRLTRMSRSVAHVYDLDQLLHTRRGRIIL